MRALMTVGIGVLAWMLIGVATALVVGPWLRRNAAGLSAPVPSILRIPARPSAGARSRRRLALPAVAAVGMLVGGAGLAHAGDLPTPVQNVASEVLGTIGFEIPRAPYQAYLPPEAALPPPSTGPDAARPGDAERRSRRPDRRRPSTTAPAGGSSKGTSPPPIPTTVANRTETETETETPTSPSPVEVPTEPAAAADRAPDGTSTTTSTTEATTPPDPPEPDPEETESPTVDPTPVEPDPPGDEPTVGGRPGPASHARTNAAAGAKKHPEP